MSDKTPEDPNGMAGNAEEDSTIFKSRGGILLGVSMVAIGVALVVMLVIALLVS